MKLSELIRAVCRLGDAAHAFVNAHLERTHPGQTCVLMSAYADIPPAPARQEQHDLLRRQSPAFLCMLLTVWRLGRGDFVPDDDWLEEYLETGDKSKDVNDMIAYLMRKNLPPFLTRALHQLADAGIDVDDLLE